MEWLSSFIIYTQSTHSAQSTHNSNAHRSYPISVDFQFERETRNMKIISLIKPIQIVLVCGSGLGIYSLLYTLFLYAPNHTFDFLWNTCDYSAFALQLHSYGFEGCKFYNLHSERSKVLTPLFFISDDITCHACDDWWVTIKYSRDALWKINTVGIKGNDSNGLQTSICLSFFEMFAFWIPFQTHDVYIVSE